MVVMNWIGDNWIGDNEFDRLHVCLIPSELGMCMKT